MKSPLGDDIYISYEAIVKILGISITKGMGDNHSNNDLTVLGVFLTGFFQKK